MNDSDPQPEDATLPEGESLEATSTPAETKPERVRKLPLIDPGFGKLCWIVTVVPYVIYLGGMGFASYLEGSRVHTCIDRQEKRVRAIFMDPVRTRFQEESGGKDADPDYVVQKMGELGLTRLHKELDVLAEYKSKEVQQWFAPIVNGPAPNESRPWLLELYSQVKEPVEFLDKMLAYDAEGKGRPILAQYYQAFPDEDKTPEGVDAASMWFPPDRTWYPTTYTIVISLTALSMFLVFPLYFRHPFKVTHWSVIVGVLGIFVWIGLWWLDKNVFGLAEMMSSGGREAFNPFEEMADSPDWRKWFTIIRFSGLVLVVPFVEEFFIRGWLMRYIEDPDWDRIPIGAATKLSIIGVAVYAVFSHTFEPLAAIVWFSMVTWLYLKTKSIWDCVIAHAITNALLGVYVLMTNTWELW